VLEFGAFRLYFFIVYFQLVFSNFDDSVLCVFQVFEVGVGLSIFVGVVAVASLFIAVFVAATVLGVVDDVLKLGCFSVFDDVEDFSVFLDGSLEVA